MRTPIPALAGITAFIISGCAVASHEPGYAGGYEYAPVEHVEPIVEYVRVPYQEPVCYEEEVYYREPRRRSAAPTIVGAIIGGVVGNQFGSGSGRRAATAAGAILGGSIAKDANRQRHPDRYHRGYEERCDYQTRYREEQRILGYDVTYRYNGRLHETRLDYDPGERIRINWAVDG